MKNLNDMLKMLEYKYKMSQLEQETLLSELIVCYVTQQPSSLMGFLQLNQFDEFKEAVRLMNSVGTNLKSILTSHGDSI